MAKVDALPTNDIILALRGVLDYYVWRGIVCVRSWPRKPLMPRSPAVTSAAEAFADYAQRVTYTDPAIVAAIQSLPGAETWTWRDALTSAIYGHAYP